MRANDRATALSMTTAANIEPHAGDAAQPGCWTPLAGDISSSGDLGYTWGRYIYSVPDEDGIRQISHGKYMTVWKRQADGGWKAVLDGGNPNPPPRE